ncbi:hypothetical protein MCOR14_003715 [Pyricularia oryzae]|nr:hypothetical protein MCOR34_006689 [Pyricularia oryzae]KAI6415232.1 hypothetical protein MCOR20_001717 [Pyricularia oryzae]KAI6464802.1 hypothetical protein MCOR17_005210 [Pyricularia oryzae]KAI6473157.1 hypothetical protein MCOR15_000125 [Pyricularia oryzae]KAI6507121.1 hypothetical protein MCOR13_002918 [Pyricularia oryzae]
MITNPVDVLSMAAFAQASDPRDSLLGFICLLQPGLALITDYTLSAVRASIGLIAHHLPDGNTPRVLLHPGPRHTGRYPS